MTDPNPSPDTATETPLDQKIRDRVSAWIENVLDPQAAGHAVLAVLDLHGPWRIYQECGHDHATDGTGRPTEPGVRLADDVGAVCDDGYMYSICRECCAASGESQTEDCATYHNTPDPCYPCPTVKAMGDALFGSQEAQS